MKYILELTNAEDPRQESSWCAPLESALPIPIAAVGDEVEVSGRESLTLIVVKRLFLYLTDRQEHYVQLFCRRK